MNATDLESTQAYGSDALRPWLPPYWRVAVHGEAWERAKAALRRDWEQTRCDLHAGGRELNQTVGDTIDQALGLAAIPPGDEAVPLSWEEAQLPLRYGVGARLEYEHDNPSWDPILEASLSAEWNERRTGRSFQEVKHLVRAGWEHGEPDSLEVPVQLERS